MKQLAIVTIWVHDYDEAIVFYTEKLGFQLVQNAGWGGTQRWVCLCLPEQQDLLLLFHLAQSECEKALVGKQTSGGNPLYGFSSDHIQEDYQRMQAAGVRMYSPPREEPWGIGFLFHDLYGNLLYVNQFPDAEK